MWIRTFALLCCTLLAACSSAPAPTPVQGGEAIGEPPEDFTLGVTVTPPAPTGGAVAAPAARYIVLPDWILRVALGPGVTEETFPAQTRQLTPDQVRRIWWELRDSGLLAPDHPALVGVTPPAAVSKRGAPVGTRYLVSYAVNGARRTLALDTGRASPEDIAAAQHLVDRLAALAWIGQP